MTTKRPDPDTCFFCKKPCEEDALVCRECSYIFDPYVSCNGCPIRFSKCHSVCKGYLSRQEQDQIRRYETRLFGL